MLSDKLKELRKQRKLTWRKVVTAFNIDAATFCKDNYAHIRVGKQVVSLVCVPGADKKELFTLWLADRVKEIIEFVQEICVKQWKW